MRTPEAVDTAYDAIRNAIITGELAPGEPLVEAALARWCQVSRTPVREAIGRLIQDGIVRRTGRGIVVRERSPEEILDLYDTRIVLEGSVARVAAERRGRMDLTRIRGALRGCEALKRPSPPDMTRLNREFHDAVWRASHNESLIDLLERLGLHVARYSGTTLTHQGRWEASLTQHRGIFDAIERQDPPAAQAMAEVHFSDARDIRLAQWTSLALGD